MSGCYLWYPNELSITDARAHIQREFYRARHNRAQPYCIPFLAVSTAASDIPGIRQALAATRRLLEMYRRQISDDKSGRRLQRLDRRLLELKRYPPEWIPWNYRETLAGARHESGCLLWGGMASQCHLLCRK
jgi:hypothetical protein